VSASFQATDDATGEFGVGDAAAHAVVAAGLLRVLEAVETAQVRFHQHWRVHVALRYDGVAQALSERERIVAAQNGHGGAI
jgi:hypothetical protein